MKQHTQTYGPYTAVRQAGNTYYVSGQVGINPESKQTFKDVKRQTSQVLLNLAAVLEAAGLELKDIVKTTIYLTNMSDFSQVNEVYEQFFPLPRPARATVGVAALPAVAGDTSLLVEIEAVAYKAS